MRRIGYALLVLAIVLVAGISATFLFGRSQDWRNLQPVRNADLDERVLFESIGGRTMRFNAATNHGWFALQGFAVAPVQARRDGLRMNIEISLESAGRAVLHRERRYTGLHRLDEVQPYGALGGQDGVPVWILPTEWIDLSRWPRARSVSVRVLARDPAIRTVLWRGAIDTRLGNAQTNLRFRRLGGAAREALTADWITPSALIAPEVKRELVRYRLQRIGPLGQPQVDFRARTVLRVEPIAVPRSFGERPRAIALTPTMRVSFVLDVDRSVEIDARASDSSPLPATLTGTSSPSRPVQGRWRGELGAGRYELRTNGVGNVEVREGQAGDSLVPDGLRPRFHVAAPAHPLRYALFPVRGAVPPLRLALRARSASGIATLTFLDAGGTAIGSQRVDVRWIPSVYDRPADAPDQPAAEPIRLDVQPPPAARALRIEADAEILATASTTLPSDDGLAVDPRHRWFTFFPEFHPRSPLSQGIVIVQQPRAGGPFRATPERGLAIAAEPGTARAVGTRTPAASVRRAAPPARPILRLRPDRGGPETDE